MSKELKEAVKEFFRVIVLAAIPVFIVGLEKQEIDLRMVLVIVGVAGLKFVDKLLHESGVAKKGLTHF